MSTEWNEENIKEHLFTEVEVGKGGFWTRAKLDGFRLCAQGRFRFIADGKSWLYMRPLPKLVKRLIKPIELAGRWLDFGDDGMALICGFDEDCVMTSHDSFEIEALNCHAHGCQGWRDTPTSELNTSFEVL